MAQSLEVYEFRGSRIAPGLALLSKQDIYQDDLSGNDALAAPGRGAWPIRAALLPVSQAPEIIAPWRRLCRNLVEENPFFEPWALAPALTAYADAKVKIACIWAGVELIGLLPVQAVRGYANLPVAYWETWTHPHCYFGAPLVRRGFSREFFSALFSLLCEGDRARAFLRLRLMDEQGPLASAMKGAGELAGRIVYQAGAYERAALFAGLSADIFLASNIRKKKRKELRRLRNRLEERGRVTVRILTETDRLEEWAEQFLALEDKSWKGQRGTSLKAAGRDALWFQKTLCGARAAGKLHFIRLDLDARPIAMLVSFLSKGAGYSLKICHDPGLARFSPGVMAEIEASQNLLGDPAFNFMDSCAARDHPMINSLWRDRRRITGLNISAVGALSKATLSLCRTLEAMRARLPNGEGLSSGRGAS